MRVFMAEANKFFIKQKGIFVLLGMIFLQVWLWTQTIYIPNLKIELSKQAYFAILEDCGLHGVLGDEEVEAFSQYQSALEQAQKDFVAQASALSAGEIDYSTYVQNTKNTIFSNEAWTAVEQIKQQIDYVKGDTDTRYVTYTNGWEILFTHAGPYITAVFVLVLAALLFAPEYENRVHTFLLTMPNGKGHTICAKLTLEVLVIMGFLFTSEAGYALYLHWNFGLGDVNFPVQSLPSFDACPYRLSIGSAFLVCVLLKGLTYIGIGLAASFLYTFFKNAYSGTIAALLAGVLPTFLWSEKTCWLPMISFLESEAYLKGFQNDGDSVLVLFDKLMLILGVTVLWISVLCAGSTVFWKRKST